MKTSFKLFNFVGAPVEISLWFFLIFLMAPISWGIAIFLSVLIHEMAHAYVVDTNIPEKDSIPVVAAGPLSNLLFAIIVLLVTSFVGSDINPIVFKFLNDLFVVNLILFIFNLLPIYPMDGGRIVKDFLFLKMRSNRRSAKRIAGGISLVFSIGLLLYSILTFNIIMILFSALFIYYALIELEIIDTQK